MVTFGLPDDTLDTTVPVSAKHFRVNCTAPLETFSVVIFYAEKPLCAQNNNHYVLIPCFSLSKYYSVRNDLLKTQCMAIFITDEDWLQVELHEPPWNRSYTP